MDEARENAKDLYWAEELYVNSSYGPKIVLRINYAYEVKGLQLLGLDVRRRPYPVSLNAHDTCLEHSYIWKPFRACGQIEDWVEYAFFFLSRHSDW